MTLIALPVSVCVCVHLCVCVCPSVASRISETSELIAIEFHTVTASVTRMLHMLIVLTLTFIQGHIIMKIIDLIISETVQAILMKFTLNIFSQKVCIIFSQFDVDFRSRSQLHLKLDKCFSCNSNISDSISPMAFKLGMTVDFCMAYMLMFVSMTLQAKVTVYWQRKTSALHYLDK